MTGVVRLLRPCTVAFTQLCLFDVPSDFVSTSVKASPATREPDEVLSPVDPTPQPLRLLRLQGHI